MIISQIFCQNYVSCVVVCVYDCVRLLFWCVFLFTHMYIYQISCVYSAKPPSENEERKFIKKKKIITKI